MTPDELHALDMAVAKAMRLDAYESDVPDCEKQCVVSDPPGAMPRVFQPTRSRADAMEVLEFILKKSDVRLRECEGRYRLQDGLEVAIAGTLEIAICKFALEAGRGRG